ncbi:MAG TPA: methyltransferase [Terriglobia bacterium]
MLWLRGIIFTVLIPGSVAWLLPQWLRQGRPPAGGLWSLGWLVFALGATIYALCLVAFLRSGGTPIIFFMRPFPPVRFLLGEEPNGLVENGLYRYSRNPMYLGVLTAVFGQAIAYRAAPIAGYGAAAAIVFHLVVVLIEEPHLTRTQGPEYEAFCRRVPRWIGRPRA